MQIRTFSALSLFLALLAVVTPLGRVCAAGNPTGVVGDGVTDDTTTIQAALDQAGKSGGAVALGPGSYLIKGSLTVPTGVTLQGSWEEPHHGAWDKGTTLLLTGGRGQEDGPAAVTLSQSSALRGVTMVWPDEKPDNIVPYPWAIHGSGMHDSIENVTFVNAYQGIEIGRPWSELHLIRNVFGCVLRRGVLIDETSDIGRIENVHFNTHYWIRSRYPSIQMPDDGVTGKLVTDYTMKNLEAFIFGRTDWEYVLNTFVWGARIGYRFIHTPAGECNGQFMGIGADACDIGLLVDQIQSVGIQVTNGEFTAFSGETKAGIVVSPGATGAAQFVNCNFWSTPGGAAQLHGSGQVIFNACHFSDGAEAGVIQADKGTVTVNSCSFGSQGRAVVLKPGVRSAIVTSNSQPGGLVVDNGIGPSAQIGLNEAPYVYPASITGHYLLKIGAAGDNDFLGAGWYGGESASGEATDNIPGSAKAQLSAARWTNGDATLRLPVHPGAAYTLTVWLLMRPHTPLQTISAQGVSAQAAAGKSQRLVLTIPAAATSGQNTITVKISGVPWSPATLEAGNGDIRQLGARVFGIEMKSATGPVKTTVINQL